MGLIDSAGKALALTVTLSTNFVQESGYAQKELKKLIGVVDFLKGSVKDYEKTAKFVFQNAALGYAVFSATAVKKLYEIHRALTMSSLRYATIGRDVKAYENIVLKSAEGTGLAADQILEINQQLLDFGMKTKLSNKQLSDLSKTIFKFSEITGISAQTTSRFVAQMKNIGVNVTPLLQNLRQLSTSMMLSTTDMEDLLEITRMTSTNISLFNVEASKSPDKMQNFAKEAQNLAAAMKGLGMSTSTVTRLMESLTDPMAYVDNMKQMSLLGFTFDEVGMKGLNSAGKITKMRNALLGFKQLGEVGFSKMLREVGMRPEDAAAILNNYQDLIKAAQDKDSIDKVWARAKEEAGSLKVAWNNFVTSFLISVKPLADSLATFMKGVSRILNWFAGLAKDKSFATLTAVIVGSVYALSKTLGWFLGKIAGNAVKTATDIAGAAIKGAQAVTQAVDTSTRIITRLLAQVRFLLQEIIALWGGVSGGAIVKGTKYAEAFTKTGLGTGEGALLGAGALMTGKELIKRLPKATSMKDAGALMTASGRGLGAIAGGAGAGMGLAAVAEVFNAAGQWKETENKGTLLAKSAINVAGAGIGAAIGTAILPGIGTMIGGMAGQFITSKLTDSLMPLKKIEDNTAKSVDELKKQKDDPWKELQQRNIAASKVYAFDKQFSTNWQYNEQREVEQLRLLGIIAERVSDSAHFDREAHNKNNSRARGTTVAYNTTGDLGSTK